MYEVDQWLYQCYDVYKRIARSLRDGGVFLLADYTACCEEGERYVHFDIPLTLEHEMGLLQDAGFSIQQVIDEPEEATLIVAKRGKIFYL